MQDAESDTLAKRFDVPPAGWSGLYIYRDGMAFRRDLYVDGHYIGKTGSKTYFYRFVRPGEHWVQTGGNRLQLHAIEGVNHFVRQWVRMGNVIPETVLWGAPSDEGTAAVSELLLAADSDDPDNDLANAPAGVNFGSKAAIRMLTVDRSTIDAKGLIKPGHVDARFAPPDVRDADRMEADGLLRMDGLGDGTGASVTDGEPDTP